jgi:multiple sugar transport system substrate-binding protein
VTPTSRTERGRKFRIAVRKFGPFESAIQKQWDAFEAGARTGLELDTQALELHALFEALFASGGLLGGDWDVAFINTDWVAHLHKSRAALDLAPLIHGHPPDDYPEGWTRSLLRLQQDGDSILGLPYHDGPECLIYRKDLFADPEQQARYQKQHDAALCVPTTWEEFHQVAKHFQQPERGWHGAIFAAFPDGHNTVYDFLLQLWTRGGELLDERRRVRLDSPAAIQGLEFYRAILNDSSAIHPSCREMDSVRAGMAFAAGEAAMMVNWFGFAAMAEVIPDSRIKASVDLAAIPCAPGCRSTSLNIYWILSIAAGSRHPDVAYAFLRHCASAHMDKLLTSEGGIGCRKSTWHDDEINRAIPFYNRLESLHEHAREIPRMEDWPRVAEVIDELVLGTINGPEPVADLAQVAQATVERLF